MAILTDDARRDETRLLQEARGGSTEALGALYTLHAAAVYRLAYRILDSAADAEDVLQDVFVGLPEALAAYREQGRFGSWLKRVAARYALMKLRARGRRRELSIDETGWLPAAGSARELERIALTRALQRLPEPLRLVFSLKEIEGYGHSEIAALLGITPGASAARLFRAWKALRQEIDPS